MDPSQADFPPASSSQQGKVFLSKRRDTSLTRVAESQEQERRPEEQNDIYRGGPLSPLRSRPSSPATVSSKSSSSSSGLSGLGLRRGALGAILDRAINRWARARSATSSTSTISSASSIHNRFPRKRTRRSSIATSQNTHNETIIRARRRVWELSRGVPREFTLFLPTALAPPVVDNRDHSLQDRRVFRSTSLPLILSQLDSTIKHSARRKHKQSAVPSHGRASGEQGPDTSPFISTSNPLRSEDVKGKTSENIRMQKPAGKAGGDKFPRRPAWWLDVSSPNWSDMREIGKLLHLHPLTLEDILHQESREKLEVFPRLGYYFIVFRALESELTRSKAHTQLDLTMKGDKTVFPFANSTIGAANVYIVVFREGICTFHFEDISDHTLRVRNRIISLEETLHMSSDWIAHGILDSIVDQFFPLLNSIEAEVKDLDNLVLSIDGPLRDRLELGKRALPNKSITKSATKGGEKIAFVDVEIKEKSQTAFSTVDNVQGLSLRCVRQFAWGTSVIRRFVSTFPVSKVKRWSKLSRRKEVTPSASPLIRMASTRRLVVSLTRLLGTKSEVMSQIRKRLSGDGFMGSYTVSSERVQAGEMGIYLGDIQDHIFTLQQSLAHYEHMLNHSHPAYLSHLHVSSGKVTASMDYKLFFLTLLTVTIMAMQIPVGVVSLNVNMPRNLRITPAPNPPAPFNAFMAMLVIELIVCLSVTSMTRYWWLRAKRKFARARQSKF